MPLDRIWYDLRYAVRTLLKRPVFAAAVVTTLGLGVGVSATMFTVINAVILRALPFDEPDELVAVWERDERSTQVGADRSDIAPANLADWERQSQSFAGFAAYTVGTATLTGSGDPEEIPYSAVSPSFMSLLGVHLVMGRSFLPDDSQPSAQPVVLLGEMLWRRRFGSDPAVLTRSIDIGGERHAVIGVVPAGSGFPRATELWTVRRPTVAQQVERSAHYLRAVARLHRGVGLNRAETELNLIARHLREQYPTSNAGLGVNLVPLQDEQNGSMREALLVLFGAVCCVLLVACANVGGLFVARSASRESEMALRAALGASRLRIVQQFLAESLVLSACGAVLGLLLAAWGTRLVLAASPVAVVPASGSVSVDAKVVAFALAISIVTAIAFALLPAFSMSAARLNDGLRNGGRQALARSTQARGRRLLVGVQLALTMVLLAGTGLMLRTLARLHRVDLGFVPSRLLTAEIRLPGSRYPAGRGHSDQFFAQLTRDLQSAPGIQAASAVFMLPFSRDNRIYSFRTTEAPDKQQLANFRVTTPGYFATMQVPLLRGRDFTAADTGGASPVVIVNDAMARRFWPNESALGHAIFIRRQTIAARVVGIVNDVKYFGHDSPAEPEMYVPHAQLAMNAMTVVVRARGEATAMASAIVARVHAIDRDLAVGHVKTMTELVDDSLAVRRFTRLLLAGFAVLGLVLSCVGLYGLVAYSVTQRTTEIGIRMALGAAPGDVVRLVASEAVSVTAGGIILGIAGALVLGRALSGFVFGVSAWDPFVLTAAAVALTIAALAASVIPAVKAARLMPATVLRRV